MCAWGNYVFLCVPDGTSIHTNHHMQSRFTVRLFLSFLSLPPSSLSQPLSRALISPLG